MRAICVDDEELVLQLTVSLLKELPLLTEVEGFSDGAHALRYLKENPADLALLDIDMPDMSGIFLAKQIREISPDTEIMFLTGYSKFALDAFSVHASGYLLKPVSREKLAAEVAHALRQHKKRMASHVEAKTFGEFELLVDGNPVVFPRARAKEVLAYLVDRQGGSVTRAAIYAALWEEGFYDRPMQKYLDVIIRSLKDTLSAYGVGDILKIEKGKLRILPERIDCDLYRFLGGDEEAVRAYRGEYMSAYTWANVTEGILTRKREPFQGRIVRDAHRRRP